MVLGGQRVQPERYTIIPRTLSFIFRDDKILLMKIGPDRGAWAGKYNGVGGHIESGEDPLSSARREVAEETGLSLENMLLTGIVHVDTGGSPGVGLYIFTAEVHEGELVSGTEGASEWVALSDLNSLPLVADLRELLPAVINSRETGSPFSAITSFDAHGHPMVKFSHG